ncbi:MAG: helix-turn-helix domain-containing protein [Chloroflexi bacterium]|nr:helix-turn-helix domain-containing protein [Chloroflexota bacterium]
MNFNEKLRILRKQSKFSQEQLAEKINVSRQAITKWETDGGLPDIENLLAISALFSISLDDLLSEEKLIRTVVDYTYESITEYDISCPSHFDIHAPGALEVYITTANDEKLRVRLASNVLQTLPQDYKVKIDEHRNRLDVDIRRIGKNSEAEGKEALSIYISLPAKYSDNVELSVIADILRISRISFPLELDGKVRKVFLEEVKSIVALNCNVDMDIHTDKLPSAIEINQINATSVLHIPSGAKYYTKIKGKTNQIRFAVEGQASQYHADADAENRIELAGLNAELLIDRMAM